jgi:hypothetical protein
MRLIGLPAGIYVDGSRIIITIIIVFIIIKVQIVFKSNSLLIIVGMIEFFNFYCSLNATSCQILYFVCARARARAHVCVCV